jgi:hypothetical protein
MVSEPQHYHHYIGKFFIENDRILVHGRHSSIISTVTMHKMQAAPPFLSCDEQNVTLHCQMPSGGQNHPYLRTTSLESSLKILTFSYFPFLC